jgi:hypothetical protein
MADVPKGPNREQKTKMLMDKYPGHISWASDRANFSGCRLIRFTPTETTGLEVEDAERFLTQLGTTVVESAEDAANLYFSIRANLLVVDTKIDGDDIVMLVTTQLDDDDLAELQETQTRIQLGMREWKEQREAEKEKEREALIEERRLIEVGRKAEQYNVFERLRKLEKGA